MVDLYSDCRYVTGKVSIIMPVYNNAVYLREALGDIMRQSYNCFELICVDDGSTDGATDVLRSFAEKDARIKIIFRNHEGAGTARNVGLEQADGEYVLFLDSDDRFEENLLLKATEEAKEKKTDILMYDAGCIDAESGEELISDWIIQRHAIPQNDVFSYENCSEDILILSFNVPWNKLYRHTFIDNNKLYFQNTTFMNDVFFVHTSMIAAKRIAFLDLKLVRYRRNGGGALSRSFRRQKEPLLALKIMRSVRDELIKRDVYERVKRSFNISACHHLLGNLEMVDGDVYYYIYPLTKQCLLDEFHVENTNFDVEHERYFQSRVQAISDMDASEYLFFLVRMYHDLLNKEVSNSYFYKRDLWREIEIKNNIIENLKETIEKKNWKWRGKSLSGKKVVLYGAGDVGVDYYKDFLSMQKGPNIVAWVDKNFKSIDMKDTKIENPVIMGNIHFDYVVIAVRDSDIAAEIRNYCLEYAENEKILWYEL